MVAKFSLKAPPAVVAAKIAKPVAQPLPTVSTAQTTEAFWKKIYFPRGRTETGVFRPPASPGLSQAVRENIETEHRHAFEMATGKNPRRK